MLISIVVPPLGEPTLPNMAAELLASMARSSGHESHVVHTPLFSPMSFAKFIVDGVAGPAIFAPAYYGDADLAIEMERVASAMQVDIDLSNRNGRFAEFTDEREIADRLYFAASEVPHLLSRIVDAILSQGTPDMVAITVPFDKDKLPTGAIAQTLRRRDYHGPIVCGGTGLPLIMGQPFLENFPEVDFVISGEAEQSWPLFCAAIAQGVPPSGIPGLTARLGDGMISEPPAELSDDFAQSPPCDWTSFLEQRKGTRWESKVLTLMAESSRGCWWGAKHQCRFCSVSMADHPYRAKPWQAVVGDFIRLYDTHHPDVIMTSDAVLAHQHLDEFLKALHTARQSRPWTIFYEVKSTYSRRTIARFASAGITDVQPGIESFSTTTLRRMNKGATGIQQLNFLKWATAYRMNIIYCIMCGTPGETADDLLSNIGVVERIPHYQPATVHGLYLFRGSPYHTSPTEYGFTDLTAGHLAAYMYRRVDPILLAHNVLYDMPSHRSLGYERAVERLKSAGSRWEERWLQGSFSRRSRFGPSRSLVARGSHAQADASHMLLLSDHETSVLDGCEEPKSLKRVRDRAGLSSEDFDAVVQRLTSLDLLFVDNGLGLTLPIPADADAERDAGWAPVAHPESTLLSIPTLSHREGVSPC